MRTEAAVLAGVEAAPPVPAATGTLRPGAGPARAGRGPQGPGPALPGRAPRWWACRRRGCGGTLRQVEGRLACDRCGRSEFWPVALWQWAWRR